MRILITLVLTFMTGCAVGPKYTRPAVQSPLQFRGGETPAENSSLADLPWWEVFSDRTLQTLIQKAVVNNYDLRVAITRIEQARQLAAEARSEFLPSVRYQGATSGGRNEFAGSAVQNGGAVRGSFASLVGVAWEADLWGRIRHSNEAALASYLQTEQARRAIQLSVASETAQAWFELLGLDWQREIAMRTTESFTNTLNIFTQRLEGGIASRLDTSRAAAARASASATVSELERQIMLKENQISVLLGQNPGPILNRSTLLDQPLPPDVPVGLPSELLERRPDVLAAEQQVRVANAEVGIATAAFFPRIGLTSFLGGLSTPLLDINAAKAAAFSFAENTAGPLYQGGSLKAEKRRAIALWEQAKLQYQQTTLQAFEDVSNALISRQKFEAIRADQTETVAAYKESVDVALKRYIAGRASYFEVLEAQQQLFPAENALAVTEMNRRAVVVQLYKSLGGGWKLSNAQWPNPIHP